MNNDKIYTAIVEMLKCYEMETGRADGDLEKLVKDSNRLRELAAFDACPNIYASAARVLVDIMENYDKQKTGSAGRLNVCKRLIKECTRRDLAGMGYDENRNIWYILDGYRMFRFSEDLPSLPRMPGKFEHEKVIPETTVGRRLPTPTTAELKAHIAAHGLRRNGRGQVFAYTPQGWPTWIAVNVFFLLDVLQVVGPDVNFREPVKAWTPIYFADGRDDVQTDGIILPIRTEAAKEAWNDELNRRDVERRENRRQIA